jgi:integrase
MADRHDNRGLRKRCECHWTRWPKCPHQWHFNFKWRGAHHRYSLDRLLCRRVESKGEAEAEVEGIRDAIRKGTFQRPGAPDAQPQRDRLTVAELLTYYVKRHVTPSRPRAVTATTAEAAVIGRVTLDRPVGAALAFGAWPVVDVTTDSIELFRAARAGRPVAANRNLALLRAAFSWAVRVGLLERTPFKRGTETVVRLSREIARRRRLEGDEGTRLLKAARGHLRALLEAALESGCRKGELLSLQWRQVRWAPRAELVLPAGKTKTKQERTVPISSRLRAILEMRRNGPDGEPHPPEAYVFGNEIGQRVITVKTAWRLACRRAKIADLHFHDLRREAGSRWLEGGVPLQIIQAWLGHANIDQTSTYLSATAAAQHSAMGQYEARVQQRATKVRKRGRKRPRPAALADKTPNKTGIGLH